MALRCVKHQRYPCRGRSFLPTNKGGAPQTGWVAGCRSPRPISRRCAESKHTDGPHSPVRAVRASTAHRSASAFASGFETMRVPTAADCRISRRQSARASLSSPRFSSLSGAARSDPPPAKRRNVGRAPLEIVVVLPPLSRFGGKTTSVVVVGPRFDVFGATSQAPRWSRLPRRVTFQRFETMLCEARLRFDVSRRLAPSNGGCSTRRSSSCRGLQGVATCRARRSPSASSLALCVLEQPNRSRRRRGGERRARRSRNLVRAASPHLSLTAASAATRWTNV